MGPCLAAIAQISLQSVTFMLYRKILEIMFCPLVVLVMMF